jgi:hypothetical protein
MKFSLFLACFALSIYAYSQAGHSHRLERSLKFPDVAGYKTMKYKSTGSIKRWS